MNRIITLFLMFFTVSIFCQKVTLNIKNDTINNKVLFKNLANDVLKTIYVKSENFDADVDFEEGYYLLEKEGDDVLLYLRRDDDLVINFNAEDFYKTLVFTGKGSERNTFLLNKQLELIDRKGRLRNFYKKDFYEGDENKYLKTLDNHYKSLFDNLFSSGFDKSFVDAEMKNLQYGYSLDLLKFQEAKKHYELNDSIKVSTSFLESLNYTHFDKSELAKRFYSYKNLAILKWKKDIENSANIKMMQDVVSSIRTESIQQGVLEALYNDMSRENPLTKNYYNLIKANSPKYSLLLSKAKAKYAEIRQVVAEKNLSKFSFKGFLGERFSLADFKGNYIFITVWLSSCETCIDTFKEIEKLKKKYKNEAIVFVGVSVDKEDEFNDWSALVQENNIEDKQLFFNGSKSRIVKEFNISTLPSYVLLSLKGEVMDVKIDSPASKETKKLINKLLKEM